MNRQPHANLPADSGRKQAELEHATLVALVENSPDAVIGETLGGIITSWNPGAERLFGYSPAEAIGRHISLLAPPENPGDILQIIRRVRQGELVQRVAAERVHKDGRRLIVSLAVCPVCTADGQVAGIVKIAHDITERRQALEALQRSEESLRLLFNSVRAGIVLHTPDGAILDVNESWCQLHRVNPEQARRFTIADLSGPAMSMERARELWTRVMDGQPQSFEWESRRAGDHSAFDAEVFLRRINLRGRDMILANIRDITERKQAREALRASERRFRAMFEHAGVGILEVIGDDRFVAANPRACQILSRPLEDLLLYNVHDLTWPEDRELSDQLNAALHAGAAERVTCEKRYTRGDGSPVWAHVTISALRDAQGQWVGSIATIEDITERKRAEEAARQAREELAQINAQLERKVQERTAQLLEANANLQTFAYTAAHDLRSPLRSIRGYSQVVIEELGPQLGPQGQSLLQKAVQCADQMTRLLNDLLEYSKLCQAELPLQNVPLGEAVDEALSLLQEDIRDKAAEITVESPLPSILGHPATVTLVIANFVCNAMKFVTTGVRPKIIISAKSIQRVEGQAAEDSQPATPDTPTETVLSTPEARRPLPFVRLSIRDNGIGIAPNDLGRLFQPFQRLHSRSAYPGTGLGLAIVRRAVERMGGHVGVSSTPGQGSSFWADLRLAS